MFFNGFYARNYYTNTYWGLSGDAAQEIEEVTILQGGGLFGWSDRKKPNDDERVIMSVIGQFLDLVNKQD